MKLICPECKGNMQSQESGIEHMAQGWKCKQCGLNAQTMRNPNPSQYMTWYDKAGKMQTKQIKELME